MYVTEYLLYLCDAWFCVNLFTIGLLHCHYVECIPLCSFHRSTQRFLPLELMAEAEKDCYLTNKLFKINS